ncbi:MAG: DNA-3-methyladenine glycosylase [Candidatus Colwellbacteria bacterium]|nr:DNA-3-methyladenine glycosylase [Candidatus Colwellbacteria bacterium]
METKALRHLRKDKVMAGIIKRYLLPTPSKIKTDQQFLFSEIVETILGQQLSGKAANTIIGRFKDLYGGRHPKVEELLKTKDQKIRDCGTAWSKVSYIKNVALAIKSKELDLKKLPKMSDEDVREVLLKIKGIGNWTVEMMLMFTLHRPNIFSPGDVGLQNAMHKHYGVKRGDTNKMLKIAKQWEPHRSLACRYLWRSLDN